MKANIVYSLIILIFLFVSCSNKEINAPKNETKTGKAFLKIDKANTPSNVVEIVAYLQRSGYETISHNLNLLSDSSAEVTFEKIEVGAWHLRIDAKNIQGNIIYTGETEVTILENITVEVNLILEQVSNGIGDVHINVTWGTIKNSWIDYQVNPIFTIYNSPANPTGGVSEAKVLFEDNKYHMWYLNTYNSGRGNVGYAESADGINWYSVTDSPVLTAGKSGSWDDYTVGPGIIIKENGIYKMYYNGWQTYDGTQNIGLAVSVDGIHWEKNRMPVLSANEVEYRVGAPSLIKKDSIYYLYYSYKSQNSSELKISVATSIDGVHFDRYQNNPILTATNQWEGSSVLYSSVILENGIFKMIYNNETRNAFGKATSEDGLHWIKSAENPIFTVNNTTNHWCEDITYPYLVKFGNYYRIYYSGGVNDIKSIGLITSNKF
jgi:predicted GH43/DUF377 family glycosyl hydrolase